MKHFRSIALLVMCLALCVHAASAQENKTADAKKQAADQAELKLSDAQRNSMLTILAESKKQALPVLMQLAEQAMKTNENLLSDKPDEAAINKHKAEMGATLSQLIGLRIDSIGQMLKVLTPPQKQLVIAEAAKKDGEKDLFNVIVKKFELPEQ